MSARVVAMIADAIRAGRYSEGDRLPSERMLAAEIGVSRTVISAALDELEAAGAVVSRRGRGGGTFVVSAASLPAGIKRVRGEHRQVMRWLLEAREPLELSAVTLASQRVQVPQLRDLHRLLEQLASVVDDPDTYAEVAFTLVIKVAEASQNPFLVEITTGLMREQAALRSEFDESPTRQELMVSLGAHQAIVEALLSQRGDRIAEAVERHIQSIRAIYLGEQSAVTPRIAQSDAC